MAAPLTTSKATAHFLAHSQELPFAYGTQNDNRTVYPLWEGLTLVSLKSADRVGSFKFTTCKPLLFSFALGPS